MKRVRATARKLDDQSPITFDPVPILTPESSVLTMGSCFAVEIRDVMRAKGLRVLPDYSSLRPHYPNIRTHVERDGRVPLTDELLDWYVCQWYFPGTIRQEFERALGVWKQDPDDLWFAREVWQDPYRRALFSGDREALWQFLESFNATMREAVERADVFILTLGLTEAWRKKNDGRLAAAFPGPRPDSRGRRETEFHLQTHAECLADLTSVCEQVFDRWPDKRIIVTISPIPLARTFAGSDHWIGNCDSKSTLRSVAGEIARRFENVHYFHSYEMCTSRSREQVFREDGRHVRREIVDEIVQTFLDQFGCENVNSSGDVNPSENGEAQREGEAPAEPICVADQRR